MSFSLNFSRIERSAKYQSSYYKIFDIVEARYEAITMFRKETVSFRNVNTFEYMQNEDWLCDYGLSDKFFFFYQNPVVLGESSSLFDDNELLIALFNPAPIKRVVEVALQPHILSSSKADQNEIQALEQLDSLLEKAVQNGDYIEYIIDC